MKRFLQYMFIVGFASLLAAQEVPQRPIQKVYKVSFLIYEVEDGKKINERTYTFPVTTIDGNPRDSSVKAGTRVPITTGEKQVQYLDVGLSIECDLVEQADKFVVHGNIDMSSFALPEQGSDPRSGGNPVLRNVKQNFHALLAPGKPTPVTSLDDINSKKRLQVDMTAARIE